MHSTLFYCIIALSMIIFQEWIEYDLYKGIYCDFILRKSCIWVYNRNRLEIILL